MRYFLLINLIIFVYEIQAQNIFPPTGNVGIGTTNPTSTLQIDGNSPDLSLLNGGIFKIRFRSNGDSYIREGSFGIGTISPSETFHVNGTVGIGKLSTSNTEGLKIEYVDGGSGTTTFKQSRWGGNIYFKRGGSTGERTQFYFGGSSTHKMDIYDGSNDVLVRITSGGSSFINGGNLGIGTATPDYKLDVLGTIRAQEVKVATGWSDFVFESDYNLPTLQEVENFIDQNGHLPDIPSAEEVEENGISLGEMDAKLLQKIEELTLYTIKQENTINKQAKEIEDLKSIVQALIDKNEN